MYFIAAACVVNIGLDFFFMGALRLGPAGAALGTTLSQAVSVLLALCVILKRKSIRLSKSDFCPRKATMKDILPSACRWRWGSAGRSVPSPTGAHRPLPIPPAGDGPLLGGALRAGTPPVRMEHPAEEKDGLLERIGQRP